MSNPFSSESPTDLVNICNGIVADEGTANDLRDAYMKGDEKAEDFMKSKILCRSRHSLSHNHHETTNI